MGGAFFFHATTTRRMLSFQLACHLHFSGQETNDRFDAEVCHPHCCFFCDLWCSKLAIKNYPQSGRRMSSFQSACITISQRDSTPTVFVFSAESSTRALFPWLLDNLGDPTVDGIWQKDVFVPTKHHHRHHP